MSVEINKGQINFGEFVDGRYKGVDIPEYDLVLAKITEEPIAELHNVKDFTLNRTVLGTDTITFEVPKFIANEQGVMKPNPLFDLVEGNRLVLLDGVQYFILSKPVIRGSGDGVYKSITGFSREYELTQRLLNEYEGVSRVLYDYSNTIDENGVEVGFINYVENNTSWSLGYINKDINKRHRMLKLNTNIYKAFEEVQKTFGCIFQFDTVNKLINVYDPMQLGVNQGVYISDENYINEINQEIEDENIVTRLYLYGNNNISIQPLTVTGMPYLEDYSYYRNSNFMSDGLLKGLNKYDKVLEVNEGKFAVLLEQKQELSDDRTKVVIQLREEQADLRMLEHEWDLIVAEDEDLTEINRKIKKQKERVKVQQDKLDNIDVQLKGINDQMQALREELELGNFLTKDELKEFDYFIKEERYYDQNYTEENIEELFEEGKKVLSKISKPHVNFTVSVDDFLSMAQGRFMWDKFILGDIINLEHKKIGFDHEVRLVGYTHTPDSRSLDLKFSSIDNVYDSALYLEQLLEDAADMSSVVDFNKFKWDKGEDVDNAFSDYINHNLDLSNQALAKEDGQKPILDDRGLWLYKEMPDGKVSPEQVRAIHNVIAITKDNWETLEVAITPNGVMAKQLIGDIILGTDLKIISDSGIVEILNNVINIKDDKGRLRVALGNYANGKYGLQIKDKEGRNTVLDEDGMLQVWQQGEVDNTDENNPLEVAIYIPQNTRHIYDVKLRVRRDRFRAYSSTTESEGRIETTSEDGGGEFLAGSDDSWYSDKGVHSSRIRLESTETDVMSVETNVDMIENYDMTDRDISPNNSELNYGVHNHGIPKHASWRTQVPNAWGEYEPYVVSYVPSGAHNHGKHSHTFNLPGHSHSIDMPKHGHAVRLPDHVHQINIRAHAHPVKPLIHKAGYMPRYRVWVNNSSVTGWKYGNDDNIDITPRIKKGWNIIEIETDALGRIDATAFCQCLLNFDGLN